MVKGRAMKLRMDGNSYSSISKALDTPKSTLSDWLKGVPFSPNSDTLKRISQAPLNSTKTWRAKRSLSIYQANILAHNEIGELSGRDLMMFGIGLYLGEGAKSIESVRFVNSDPNVIRVCIAWLKKVCGVGTGNLTLAVHTYPDNNTDEIVKFWSKTTGVPISEFGRTQVDRRLGKSTFHHNKLLYGTVDLRVRAKGNPRFGVFLHRRIMGWIEATIQQVNTMRD
ncbi:hypothetical protein HYU91_00635 [Candidatus Collierbacteria bacterium]|nr:hypothetical protein [Candidatus Collierbacteria bacterium]